MRTASLRLQADTQTSKYTRIARAHGERIVGSYEIILVTRAHTPQQALSESVGGNCTEAEIEMLMLLGDTHGQYHF